MAAGPWITVRAALLNSVRVQIGKSQAAWSFPTRLGDFIMNIGSTVAARAIVAHLRPNPRAGRDAGPFRGGHHGHFQDGAYANTEGEHFEEMDYAFQVGCERFGLRRTLSSRAELTKDQVVDRHPFLTFETIYDEEISTREKLARRHDGHRNGRQ